MTSKRFNKVLSLVLGLVLSCFDSNFSYAGDYDPIIENKGIVEEFRKKELEMLEEKCLGSSSNGLPVIYTRKRDFFGYQELREIKIINMPALLQEGDNFISNLIGSLETSLAFLIQKKDEANKFKGKSPEFVSACGYVLKDVPEIQKVAQFLGTENQEMSEAMVVSLLSLPMTAGFGVAGAILDILSIILTVTSIAYTGLAFAGKTGVNTVAKIGAKKITKEVGFKGILHNLGKTVAGGVIPKGGILGMNKCSAHMAAGAIVGVGSVALATGVPGAIMSKIDSINMETMFAKERIINIAVFLEHFIRLMVNFPALLKDCNVLVTAIDKRELTSWFFWNRYVKPQESWVSFECLRDLNCSPLGRDCKYGEKTIDDYVGRIRRVFDGTTNISLSSVKNLINNPLI